jgi:hypothetical protein
MKKTMPAYHRYGGEGLAVSSAVASSTKCEITTGAVGAASVGFKIGDGIMGATIGSSSRSCWINNRKFYY